MRLTCRFQADIEPINSTVRLDFQDNSYADRLGWREIVVTADGVTVQGEVASTSISNRLTAYPDDLLSAPLNQREISVSLIPGGESGQPALSSNNGVTSISLLFLALAIVVILLLVGILYRQLRPPREVH